MLIDKEKASANNALAWRFRDEMGLREESRGPRTSSLPWQFWAGGNRRAHFYEPGPTATDAQGTEEPLIGSEV